MRNEAEGADVNACVATGEIRRIVCQEVPTPQAGPGMLLLKTRYACICGSDLEYLDVSFDRITQGVAHLGAIIGHREAAELGVDKMNPKDLPAEYRGIRPGSIPGHEFVAEVVEVGRGVVGWSVGDRAVPGHIVVSGSSQPASQPVGYETYKAWAEYMVVPPYTVQKVPGHVSDEEAVFVEPLNTGVGSVIGSGLRPGQSGVIIGAGKIGLLAMMSAKIYGASPVIVIDFIQARLEKALALGADAVINARETNVVSEVVRLTGDGANAVVICVRDGQVLNQAVEMGSRGATIVLAGFVPPMEVNPMLWTLKQLKIVGVLGGPAGSENVSVLSMYLIAHKQIDPRPLISEIIPFADVQRAVDSVYSGQNIAVLLKP
jgi:(R,R)-butanediol dehydrogenase/meso-butanediol dehydrogenase/diacetyl reductase